MIRVLLNSEKEMLVGETWEEILQKYRQGPFSFEGDLSNSQYMEAAAGRLQALTGASVNISTIEDFMVSLDKLGFVQILSTNPVLH